MFKDKVCEICGDPAKNYLYGTFLCDREECIEKAKMLRGGPGGHKLIRVALGSENPTKIKGTQMALEKVMKNILIVPVDVDSGVSKQPFGVDEIVKGAINRAKGAFEKVPSHYGIGIEAGVVEIGGKYLDIHICAIFDGEEYTIGTSQGFQIPEEILEEVRRGEECSKAVEKVYGIKDIGKREGIIGYLTKDLVSRVDLCRDAVLMAIVPRLRS
ncbi:purine NTP phosphatase [Methanofervidicoccus sp. A16]|uniref:inosine/xanthosine triphosphatase n=1 Tax=Methanofervidicoccus sp. A16 TaxID=2607662 RepID=UPI001189591A|nr:inosine/xanthosine triphosphatase [Methanofervidicoccus sp. A16]AXI25377.1 purine NTP phosphatase [Methanofervidicoccus sp. A16]